MKSPAAGLLGQFTGSVPRDQVHYGTGSFIIIGVILAVIVLGTVIWLLVGKRRQ